MKIKIYYNKNLKMSEGKLSSQVGHVAYQIGQVFKDKNWQHNTIVVLGLRESKFHNTLIELRQKDPLYLFEQMDLGLTEVEEGTVTCFGYIE